ncbi:hypothetical protein QUF74_09450 [Candidatus Halobeggiatoa sp. HSG11]|nr:hypothetical protein [Candidatus Halobeggiatoa sp. HSG11]
MIQIHPEYIFDKELRKKAVIIPSLEWDIIVSEMEELDDIRAYDAAKEEESIPFEQAVDEIKSGIVK